MNALRARVPLVVALTTVALTTVSVQSRLQPAPGAHVVTITPPGQTGSEPAIAVNPNNTNQVVGVGGRWTAYSTDGGRTFTPVQPRLGANRSGGDVSLAFDDKGNVFLSFLSIQKNGLPGYWGHGPGANGIFVRRSPDGGKTWDRTPSPLGEWNGDDPDVKLEDMPRIWTDTQPHEPASRQSLHGVDRVADRAIRSSSSRSTDAGRRGPRRCASARTRAVRATTTARWWASSAPSPRWHAVRGLERGAERHAGDLA